MYKERENEVPGIYSIEDLIYFVNLTGLVSPSPSAKSGRSVPSYKELDSGNYLPAIQIF